MALSFPPDRRHAHSEFEFVRRAAAHLTREELHEAVKVCRLGLLVNPGCLDGRLLLGTALLALNRADEALSEMRVAVELEADSARAHALLGEALLRLNQLEKGREHLLRARELDPEDSRSSELLSNAERSTPERQDGAALLHGADTKVYPASLAADERRSDGVDRGTDTIEVGDESTIEERAALPPDGSDVGHFRSFERSAAPRQRTPDEDFSTATWLPPPGLHAAEALDGLSADELDPDSRAGRSSEVIEREEARRADQSTMRLFRAELFEASLAEPLSSHLRRPSMHFDPHGSMLETRPARNRPGSEPRVPAREGRPTAPDQPDLDELDHEDSGIHESRLAHDPESDALEVSWSAENSVPERNVTSSPRSPAQKTSQSSEPASEASAALRSPADRAREPSEIPEAPDLYADDGEPFSAGETSEISEHSEISESAIVTTHFSEHGDDDDSASEEPSWSLRMDVLDSTMDDPPSETREISASAIHILPETMPPLPPEESLEIAPDTLSEAVDDDAGYDALAAPFSSGGAADSESIDELSERIEDAVEQGTDAMTRVRFEKSLLPEGQSMARDAFAPDARAASQFRSGVSDEFEDFRARGADAAELDPGDFRKPASSRELKRAAGSEPDLSAEELDSASFVSRAREEIPPLQSVESSGRRERFQSVASDSLLASRAESGSYSESRAPDPLRQSAIGRDQAVRRDRDDDSALFRSFAGRSAERSAAGPYKAPPRTAALTDGASGSSHESVPSDLIESHMPRVDSLDEEAWSESASHFDESVVEQSELSEGSLGAAAPNARGERPRPRSPLQRRRRRLAALVANLLDMQRGHGKIVVASVCVGIVVLALGIGFIVRSLRHSTSAEQSRSAANLLLRRGNLADYHKAAELFRAIAAVSPADPSGRLIHGLILALIPFEFGVKAELTPIPLDPVDAQNTLRSALEIVEALGRGKLDDAANLAFNARNLDPRSGVLQYLQGRIELLRGKPALALEYLRRANQLMPGRALQLAATGDAMLQNGDQRGAKQFYGQALEVNPKHIGALLGMSRCQIASGELNKANDTLAQISDGDYQDDASTGQRGWALLLRARVQVMQGEIGEAQLLLREARNSAPLRSATFYDELARLQIEAFRLAEAEEAAIRAANLMPGRPHPLLLKARIFLAQGRAQDAWEVMQSDLVPQDVGTLLRAEVLLALSQTSAARQQLAAAEDADGPSVKLLEARILAEERNFDGAERTARAVLAEAPDHTEALTVLAGILLAKGSGLVEARQALERAVRRDRSAIAARLRLADVLLAEGQFRTAHQHLISVTRRYSWLLPGSLRLAELNFGRRDLAAAQTTLAAILSENPNEQNALVLLIRVLLSQREYSKAEQYLLQLHGLAPGLQDVIEARVALDKGTFERAVAKLSSARQRLPFNPLPAGMLVRAYLLQGLTDEAARVVEDMRRRFPETAEYYLAHGRLELGAGRQANAIRLFKKALAQVRRSVRFPAAEASVLVLIGRAHHETDRVREALAFYRKAAEVCEFCPSARFRQGLALDELKEPKEAIASLLFAARLNPRMLQVYYELGKIYANHGKPRQAAKMYRKYLSLGPPEEFAAPVRRLVETLGEP